MSQSILGIDPGLRHTGWAVVQKRRDQQIKYVSSGVIHTDTTLSLPQRLLVIYRGLWDVASTFEVASCGIEATYVNKNALSSLKLAHARGAAIVAVSSHEIAVHEYAAKTVKKTIVGNGLAGKEQLGRMLSILMPGVVVSDTDEADALAIAMCHALHV